MFTSVLTYICARNHFLHNRVGQIPVEDFLDSLTGKQAQKVAWVLRIIEELDSVPVQYFKKLTGTGDIWEVRVQMGGDISACSVFFMDRILFVITNGFSKKTRKTPPKEIALAEQRKREYLNRSKKK